MTLEPWGDGEGVSAGARAVVWFWQRGIGHRVGRAGWFTVERIGLADPSVREK